jgi:hypothetical protein
MNLSHDRLQRLIWIDAIVTSGGTIKISVIAQTFGIKREAAHTDLVRFQQIHIGRLAYNHATKFYTAAKGTLSPYPQEVRRDVLSAVRHVVQERATMAGAERLEMAILTKLDIEKNYTRIDGEFPVPHTGTGEGK